MTERSNGNEQNGGGVLLIHPPVAKPCEPPPGIARLAGALKNAGIRCRAVDLGLEGFLDLVNRDPGGSDRWTTRAARARERHLDALRSPRGFENADAYRRAVADLNRLTETVSAASGKAVVSLANYRHSTLLPVRSEDLLSAAEHPQDDPFFPWFSRRLAELLMEENPSLVGFSLNFLSQAVTTFAMAGFLKKEHPRIKIVFGGGLVTSWMRRPGWSDPFAGLVDHCIAGPGEEALRSIMGAPFSPGHVTPDYSSFPLRDYLSPGIVLPYSASGGCWWNRCAFCPEKAEGNHYEPVGDADVLKDLKRLGGEIDPVLIHLLDNAVSPSLMQEIIQNPPGVPWYGFCRITPHLADESFARELAESGCVMLKLGLESGDQEVIDREGKGIDLQTASKALKALKRAGISTYVYLLFGTPAETREAAERTLEYTVAHAGMIDFLNLAVFNMPVHGPETEESATPIQYDGDLSLYTGFVHPRGWDRGSVRHFLDREFKRNPTVAAILRRDPPIFTSNHAPFFTPDFFRRIHR